MRWRRLLLGGCALVAWTGCIAVSGLDEYSFDDDGRDASIDGSIDALADASLPDVVTRDVGAPDATIKDASIAEAEAGPPIDAGPCGACPRGTARTLCVAGACMETRRVFVSTEALSAIQGGNATADAMCQSMANAATLGGTWKAWFAEGPGKTPRDRFTASPVPYRLLDGSQILPSSTLLLGTGAITIEHAINMDQVGALHAMDEVWTGVTTNGSVGMGTCKTWSSRKNDDTGTVGVTSKTDTSWTAIYLQSCDRTNPHLYCFEQ